MTIDLEQNLSENFKLKEFIKSDTAIKNNLDNTPTQDVVNKLKTLTENVLQKVRNHYGKSVIINSGYRGPQLNEAVGGAKTSQHCNGEAADIEIIGISNYDLAEWIKNNLDFDQLILEFADNIKNDKNSGWVHVSYKSPSLNRKQVLTINKSGTKLGLVK